MIGAKGARSFFGSSLVLSLCMTALVTTSPERANAGLCTYDLRIERSADPHFISLASDGGLESYTVNLALYAVIQNTNGNHADDGFMLGEGSFVSGYVGGTTGLKGDLWGDPVGTGRSLVNNVAPFNATGSQSGFQADLDGDGDLDVGSYRTDGPSVLPWFIALSGTSTQFGIGSGSGPSEFLIGRTVFQIDANTYRDGALTRVNYIPRVRTNGLLPARQLNLFTSDGANYRLFGDDGNLGGVGVTIQVGPGNGPGVIPVLDVSAGAPVPRVIAGAPASVLVNVRNTAGAGAPDMGYSLTASAPIVGPSTGVLPPEANAVHEMVLDTAGLGGATQSVAITVNGPDLPVRTTGEVTVLNHSSASFDGNAQVIERTLNLGTVITGAQPVVQSLNVFNCVKKGWDAAYVAALGAGDPASSGSTAVLSSNLGAFSNLPAGKANTFQAVLNAGTVGPGTYSSRVIVPTRDEDLPGSTEGNSLTLNLSGTVLAHAKPSFSPTRESNVLAVDFGTIVRRWGYYDPWMYWRWGGYGGTAHTSATFTISNLTAVPGYTASLDLLGSVELYDANNVFRVDPNISFSSLHEGGTSASFSVSLDANVPAVLHGVYRLNLRDEDLPGKEDQSLMLFVSGELVDEFFVPPMGWVLDDGPPPPPEIVYSTPSFSYEVPSWYLDIAPEPAGVALLLAGAVNLLRRKRVTLPAGRGTR